MVQDSGLPGGPVVKILPSNAGVQFPSLVKELGSHMLHDQKITNNVVTDFYFKTGPHQKKNLKKSPCTIVAADSLSPLHIGSIPRSALHPF